MTSHGDKGQRDDAGAPTAKRDPVNLVTEMLGFTKASKLLQALRDHGQWCFISQEAVDGNVALIATLTAQRDAAIEALQLGCHIIDNARADYPAHSDADAEWDADQKRFYAALNAVLASTTEKGARG